MRYFRYGPTGALLSVNRDGVATLRFRGQLLPSILSLAFDDLAAYIGRRSVQALVVRVEDSTFPMGASATVLKVEKVPRMLHKIPAAIVTAPADYASLLCHCLEMAEHGLIRRTFTQYEPALAWATRKGLALSAFPPELPYFQETL